MEKIKTEDAVGMILCQDMTQIIPGEYKGARFKKGHRVEEADIPVLLSMGKEYLYIWSNDPDLVHENDFAEAMADAVTGENLNRSGISEGKIELSAACDGLLRIDSEKLREINSLGDLMIASRHGNTFVNRGDKVAGMRLIPLAAPKEKLEAFQEVAGETPVFDVVPLDDKKAVVFTTGNEVYTGKIKDAFGPVLRDKLAAYGSEVISQEILPDDPEQLTEKILGAVNNADIILVSGGMSVDPDDQTPKAIKDTGARIVSYGAPVLPGAMFLLGYLKNSQGEEIPVCGLPGCVMYAGRTIFDLVLPRLLAGEKITAEDLAGFGEGGLCLNCDVCTFPNCGFGK